MYVSLKNRTRTSRQLGGEILNQKLIERILNKAQVPDLLSVLTQRLSQSDLQSLLLEVYRTRSQSLTPQHLLQQYEQNRLVQPATISPQQLLEFDRLAYSVLPSSFERLELSPVCPFGSNSIVAPLDQNQTATTIRNSEVCSDSTTHIPHFNFYEKQFIAKINVRSIFSIFAISTARVK
jgi:hypothetical protein